MVNWTFTRLIFYKSDTILALSLLSLALPTISSKTCFDGEASSSIHRQWNFEKQRHQWAIEHSKSIGLEKLDAWLWFWKHSLINPEEPRSCIGKNRDRKQLPHRDNCNSSTTSDLREWIIVLRVNYKINRLMWYSSTIHFFVMSHTILSIYL